MTRPIVPSLIVLVACVAVTAYGFRAMNPTAALIGALGIAVSVWGLATLLDTDNQES